MGKELRETGIALIGSAPWGTHFCQFYQSKEDLIEILVPYFKAGLENNEFCMWITSEPLGAEEAEKKLREAVKNLADYIKKGQIEILDFSQWYTKSGKFDADEVLAGWIEKENQALERGFNGLRLSGNTFWLEDKEWASFTDYEEVINGIIGNHKMLALCSYALDKCRATEIMDVVANHQFAIVKREHRWQIVESSERKKTEVALRDSEERHRTILKTAMDGFWLVDIEGHLLEVNDAYCQMSGYNEPELLTMCITDMEAVETDDKTEAHIQKTIAQGNDRFETRHRRKDGTIFDIEISVQYRPTDGGRFVAFLLDITERKQAEETLKNTYEQVRSLASRLQEVREETRTNIAHDIHDELGGALAGLKMDLLRLESIASGEEDREKRQAMLDIIYGTKELINNTIRSTRRIIMEQRPSVLDDFGLVAALEWQLEEFKTHTSVSFKLNAEQIEIDIDKNLATVVFRIFQEALANVVRHSKATEVYISLRVDEGQLLMEIKDNGRGITENEITGTGSIGILGMRERALALGGEINIAGESGKGTTLNLKIPIR